MISSSKPRIAIVGAGLSGLNCARILKQAGSDVVVVEAADAIGGRVRTDEHEGFLLDHGFQVFLSSYPYAQEVLDHHQLKLHPYLPGALVKRNQKLHLLSDPWRNPQSILKTALSPVGSFADKLRMSRLRSACLPNQQHHGWSEQSTDSQLRHFGFSEAMIDQFFRPFLGGVFLDSTLSTSNMMLRFVFGMFSTGLACLPANGMRAIPEQLASDLSEGELRTNSKVLKVEHQALILEQGERVEADQIVIATNEPAAQNLVSELKTSSGRSVYNLYFAADHSPIQKPYLVLNGNGTGIINNISVNSLVNPECAPEGQHLISVTVLNTHHPDDQLVSLVQNELADWFGSMTSTWRHLKTYRIPYALPDQQSPLSETHRFAMRENLHLCGDYLNHGSIEGALISGRDTANAILQL